MERLTRLTSSACLSSYRGYIAYGHFSFVCKSVFFYRSWLPTAFVKEVVLVNENIFIDVGF